MALIDWIVCLLVVVLAVLCFRIWSDLFAGRTWVKPGLPEPEQDTDVTYWLRKREADRQAANAVAGISAEEEVEIESEAHK
jgi:hypothetical protein